jgi:oligopeptide transport system substrate-binding protein
MTVNLGSEPVTIDPQRASQVNEFEIIMRVFSNAYAFNHDGQLVLDQAAALPSVSADGKTVTVKLRSGLTWSDGKSLTAKDWIYGVLRQLNPEVQGSYAFTLYALVGAEEYNTVDPKATQPSKLADLRSKVGVSAPDDETLVFQLKQPTPWFLSILATWNALPARQDLIEANGKPQDNQDWLVPGSYIGNGPYILKAHESGVQFTLESNPRYVLGEPLVKRVRHVMIKDAAVALNAYRAGDVDVLLGVSPVIVSTVQADATLQTQYLRSAGSCTNYLGVNNIKPPFDNVKIRQAFSAAVDRQTLAHDVAKDTGIPASQFIPNGFPGHDDTVAAQTYDVSKAQKLLSEAGYPNGVGFPPVKLTFASSDGGRLQAQALQAMLKKSLSVDITLDPLEPRAFSALIRNRDTVPQMFPWGWCQDYADPQDWYSTVFNSTATDNLTNFKNESFDALTSSADVEIDPRKRALLYRKAAEILNTEDPAIFLTHSLKTLLLKPRVQGYTIDSFEFFFGQHSLATLRIASSP